jgi:hypothetical protein
MGLAASGAPAVKRRAVGPVHTPKIFPVYTVGDHTRISKEYICCLLEYSDLKFFLVHFKKDFENPLILVHVRPAAVLLSIRNRNVRLSLHF